MNHHECLQQQLQAVCLSHMLTAGHKQQLLIKFCSSQRSLMVQAVELVAYCLFVVQPRAPSVCMLEALRHQSTNFPPVVSSFALLSNQTLQKDIC